MQTTRGHHRESRTSTVGGTIALACIILVSTARYFDPLSNALGTVLTVGVTVLAGIYAAVILRGNFVLPRWPTLAIGIVVAPMLIQLALGAFGPSLEYGAFPLYTTAVLASLLIAVPQITTQRDFFRVVSLLGALCGLYGILATVFLAPETLPLVSITDSDASIFTDSSVMSMLGAVGLIVSLSLADRSHAFGQDINIQDVLLFGGNLALLVLGASRGAIAAAVVALVVYALLRSVTVSERERQFGVVLLALGSILITAVVILIPVGSFPIPLTHRDVLWKATIGVVSENPLLGAGVYPPKNILAPHTPGIEYKPHNTYLEALLRSGLIGGAAYFGLIWGILYRAAGNRSTPIGLIALGIGLAVSGTFASFFLWGIELRAVLFALTLGLLMFSQRT